MSKIRVHETLVLVCARCEFQITGANLAYHLECSEPFPVFFDKPDKLVSYSLFEGV